MSILSDAWTKKITWAQAATQIEAYVTKAFAGNLIATQAEATILVDLKQAASDAVGAADTLLGGLIGPATVTVETAVNGLLVNAVGPVPAGIITPAIDHAIITAASALKSAIDAEVVAFRASLTK